MLSLVRVVRVSEFWGAKYVRVLDEVNRSREMMWLQFICCTHSVLLCLDFGEAE
jgi:hypothetical protein